VVERVLTWPHADRLKQLPVDEPAKGLRLNPDGVRPEVGEDAGRPGEQVVAGQDGDRVAEARVGRLLAAPDGRLVDDVMDEASMTSSWNRVAR
jgi:hypothetical protein